MDEIQEKAAFAAILLRENDPFKAALALFPDNTNRALRIATEWPRDPEVIAAIKALEESGADMIGIPSKGALLRDIWQRMQGTTLPNGAVVPVTPDEYQKLAKLYAEIQGFVQKPGTVINNNNVVAPKVLEVPSFGNLDEWEALAQRQQTESLNVSRSRH